MGHMDDSCRKLLSIANDDGVRKWGRELRADPRNSISAMASRYLWQGALTSLDTINEHDSVTEGGILGNKCEGDKALNANILAQEKHADFMAVVFHNPKMIMKPSLQQSTTIIALYQNKIKTPYHDVIMDVENEVEIIVGD